VIPILATVRHAFIEPSCQLTTASTLRLRQSVSASTQFVWMLNDLAFRRGQ